VKVIVIEPRRCCERSRVRNGQKTLFYRNQSLFVKLLENAIGVHCGDAAGIRDLGLRQRHLRRVGVDAPDAEGSRPELGEKMGNAVISIASPYADNPCPEHRLINELRPPEGACNRGVILH